MNFLFWNTGGKALDAELLALIADTSADVVALAEYPGDTTRLLRQIRAQGHAHVQVPNIACERVTLFSVFPLHCFRHKRDDDRYTIKELRTPGNLPLLLAFLHLPSKLYLSEDDQLLRATNLREEIEAIELDVGHSNTVVLGDFNMNPFDKGMISAQGLNSVPCATTARRGSRTIDGRAYSFFYNPSWNLLGDHGKPPGTYFHRTPSSLSHYWNTLDQVIVRPSLAARVDLGTVRAIEFASALRFADANRVPTASDHLPIAFNIHPELDRQ